MRFRIKGVLKSCEYVKDLQVPYIHDIYCLAAKITSFTRRHVTESCIVLIPKTILI